MEQYTKEQYRMADKILLSYPYLKATEGESENDILLAKNGVPSGIRAGVGMPTESKAMRLIARSERISSNVDLYVGIVDMVKRTCGFKKLQLIDIRHEYMPESNGGRPNWTEEAQRRLKDILGYEPSRATLFNWWKEIQHVTIEIAKRKNIL